MDKKVSIIVPVYQAAATLERCVDSCLFQKGISKDELEVILIDDGSTDGSGALADEIAKRVNKYMENEEPESTKESQIVKVIHTENFGVSHARNIGIEKALGKYICFVDADDYVLENFVENLLAVAENVDKNPEDSYLGDTGNLSSQAVIVDSTDLCLNGLCISGYQYIENSILNRNTHVWGKLFLLDVLRKNQICFKEGLTIGEDLLFLLDIALLQGKKKTVRCIGDRGYVYVDNPEGAMKRAFKESYMDEIVCWREAEDKLMAARDYLSEYSFVSVAVSQIMTALLVAGKLSGIDEKDRDKNLETIVISKVLEQVKHALKVNGAFAALELGYKIKVTIFKFSPGFYLKLYGSYKSR